ncbi:MAG TPA: hydrogenase iron-sulfur subunit [Thermoanaerobaculia bacterium]
MTKRPAPPRPAGPPAAGVRLGRLIAPVDRFFDRLYGSRWNPLHQTGNLAILFFLVSLVTGLYLFLFYTIATPHASVARIEEEIWLGSWARGMHRYAADLAMVAIVLHVLRKLVQGQTWGPRAWAWLSGVVLLAVVFLSGWTGLVLVWDAQGQQIAVEGARLFDLLPIFAEPISRTFAGLQPVPSSFFFMNLFLHVALPLGIAALLAVHVARVARPALLPPRPIVLGALAALALLSLRWPVALEPAADLLALPGEMRVDLLFAFWLPLAPRIPPLAHLALWLAAFAALAALVRLWRPASPIATSAVDEDHCSGCTHCYHDCPYEAIAMVRRERPSRQTSEYVARVDPELCVGCGICAAACAPMGVGPRARTGRDQLVVARSFVERLQPAGAGIAVLACGNGHAALYERLSRPGRTLYPTGCSGAVHTSVVELLLRRGFAGVAVLSCPPRNCFYREGPKWAEARLFRGRDAPLSDRVDRRRVLHAAHSVAEPDRIEAALAAFEARLRELAVAAEDSFDLVAECDRAAADAALREALGA